MGIEARWKRSRGKPKKNWTMREKVSERRDCQGTKYMSEHHGGEYHRTHKEKDDKIRQNIEHTCVNIRRLAPTLECTGQGPLVDGYTGTEAVAVATPSAS